MKKTPLLLAGFIAVCLFPLAWSYARTTIWLSRAKPMPVAVAQAQAASLPLSAFVADEMPVTLTGLTIVKDQPAAKAAGQAVAQASDQAANTAEGLPQLEFKVASKGGHKIKSLTFALYEFDEKGLLRRVDSWAQAMDVNDERGPAKITLQLERKLNPQHRQVLALEHVRSEGATWRADGPGLGRAANKTSNGAPSSAVVNRIEKVLPDDTGSVLCSNGFHKAMRLAQLGDGQNVTSFTCNQSNRSFSFTFNGKDLGQ